MIAGRICALLDSIKFDSECGKDAGGVVVVTIVEKYEYTVETGCCHWTEKIDRRKKK